MRVGPPWMGLAPLEQTPESSLAPLPREATVTSVGELGVRSAGTVGALVLGCQLPAP